MKQQFVILAFVAVISGILGCSNNSSTNTPAALTDQEAVVRIVNSVDSVAQFLSSEEATFNDFGFQMVDAGGNVVPGRFKSEPGMLHITSSDSVVEWGRLVYSPETVRDYNVVLVSDTVAIVTSTKNVLCDFLVAWGFHPIPSSDSVIIDTIIHKPFTEVMTRKVALKRIAHNADPLKNWVLVSITFVTSKTTGSNTFGIDSLEISDGRVGFDSTYYDPLQTWFRFGRYRESIPVFHVGDTVTVRLSVSGSGSLPEIVTLHPGIMITEYGPTRYVPLRIRMSLISQTGGAGNYTRLFERKFIAALPPGALVGRFSALTDVFPYRCIYSKTANYENEFWGLPYIVIQ